MSDCNGRNTIHKLKTIVELSGGTTNRDLEEKSDENALMNQEVA